MLFAKRARRLLLVLLGVFLIVFAADHEPRVVTQHTTTTIYVGPGERIDNATQLVSQLQSGVSEAYCATHESVNDGDYSPTDPAVVANENLLTEANQDLSQARSDSGSASTAYQVPALVQAGLNDVKAINNSEESDTDDC